MSYAQLLPQLLANRLVQSHELGPPPNPLPRGYNINAHCEFHSGAPGHTIENCIAFKCKVQDLLDGKAISFNPVSPNTQNNPMPPHSGAVVNVIEEISEQTLVTKVDEIKMSLGTIIEHLLEHEVLQELYDFCLTCSSKPEECTSFKTAIQRLMDEGVLHV